MRFKDKIVLITGSAGGIGFKTALDFGNEGAIVAVTDIDFEMATKLSNQIISNGGVAEPFQYDLVKDFTNNYGENSLKAVFLTQRNIALLFKYLRRFINLILI